MDNKSSEKNSLKDQSCDLNCPGCKLHTGINLIESDDPNTQTFTLLPGSEHIVFSPSGKIHHINFNCLKGFAPPSVLRNSKDIPSLSLTKHSKEIKKKEFEKKCSICLEADNIWLFMMPCTHTLCSGCYDIIKLTSRQCPVCREDNYGLKRSFEEQKKVVPDNKRLLSQPVKSSKKVKIPKMMRTPSSVCTQRQLSQGFEFDEEEDGDFESTLCTYESMRADALGATRQNPNPPTIIAPISTAATIGDFSQIISSNTTKLFITATTQQSINYNDLNCKIYQKSDGYNDGGFLNFTNMSCDYEWIKHSGDYLISGSNLDSDPPDVRYNMLKQGILMSFTTSKKIEVHFIDENVVGNTINSVAECSTMINALDNLKDNLVSNLGEREPDNIVILSQVTYKSHIPLKDLSKNVAPSCGLIMNHRIHACDWTDNTNMTGWACVMIYDTVE